MFDPYNQFPPMLPPTNSEPEMEQNDDRIDWMLEGATRFRGLFSLGITVTLLVRWIPALLPAYWLVAVGAIAALVFPAYLARSARLLALAICLALAVAAGHWDFLSHTTRQGAKRLEEVIQL